MCYKQITFKSIYSSVRQILLNVLLTIHTEICPWAKVVVKDDLQLKSNHVTQQFSN